MSWIPSHKELAKHPKLLKLIRLLEIEIPEAIGHLHLLWWWAADYAPDGDLSKYEEPDIAEAMHWPGSPSKLLAGLIQAGFLDDGTLQIHGWNDEDRTGGFLRKRSDWNQNRAQRQREYRERKKKNEYAGKVEH